MKRTKTMIIVSALCLAVMMTACEKNANSTVDGKNEQTTEWWEATNESMREKTTTSEETTVEEETTESTGVETTEDAATESETTSENGNFSDGNSDNGNQKEPIKTEKEDIIHDIIINGEHNIKRRYTFDRMEVNGILLEDLESLDYLVSAAALQQDASNIFYNPSNDSDDIFWQGCSYGIEGIDGCFYIEAVPYTDGKVTAENTLSTDLSKPEDYWRIRSMYANADSIGDLEVKFMGGITIGMSREEIDSMFGNVECTTSGYSYYANKNGAILIRYNDNDLAEEIYSFIDYNDYLKIKYNN